MRHSNGAASLLSTVFAFRSKSVVVANIFDPVKGAASLQTTDVDAIAPSGNNADAGILSSVNPASRYPAIDIKQKCKAADEGCILGKIRATNNDTNTAVLPPPESAAKGMDAVPSYLLPTTTTTTTTTTSSTCAPENLIDCDNGFVRNINPAKSCADACNGQWKSGKLDELMHCRLCLHKWCWKLWIHWQYYRIMHWK